MKTGVVSGNILPSLAGLDLPALIPFTKMHGLGNDYVYVQEFDYRLPHPELLAVHISRRNFGVGGDGLVLVGPSAKADFRMRIFNADGSEAEMCGNASRCVGKFLYEHKYTQKHELTLETGGGIRALFMTVERGRVSSVRVDMGRPVFRTADIPMALDEQSFLDREIIVDGTVWRGSALSMGNPHLVLPVENVSALDLQRFGPLFERHSLFPCRTNTEFVQILNPEHILMRVWERGSGATMACGTGACAALVACAQSGLSRRKALVTLPGGSLHIEWDDAGTVFMTGPAVEVFSGEYRVPV